VKNRELEAAWDYHNGTKHSYQSIRTNPHYLDWENQPLAFKIYSNLEPIPLPQHLSSSGMPALAAVSTICAPAEIEVVPSVQILAEILYLSAGITRRRPYPGGEILFRAAACTGALYHIDLYIVCGDLPGLEAGVYHFGPHDFSLRKFRAGDFRGALSRACGDERSIKNAPAVVVCASTFWRNAWKYQARAYRHCYWDNGTILANLSAAAAARRVPARVVMGFMDSEVSRLLALDPGREAPLSLVALGNAPSGVAGPSPASAPLTLKTTPLSKTEIDYPAMRDMHDASSLESEEEVIAWREETKPDGGKKNNAEAKEGRIFPLQPLSDEEIPRDTIENVIVRRGSTREFSRESFTLAELSTMLDRATRGIAADFLDRREEPLNDLYLIVHAVEGLPPGAYYFHRSERVLELLKEGSFRREAGHLGLGQDIPADCSVDVFFLVDLNRALERFGNRGYRAAQMEAAVMGGKLYLSAYAQRLGASGLTFFDDDVTEFFSPHAAGKSVMFLIALGRSVKKKSANEVS
jgi:SagB-type dehydrogenase family enzyme